MTQKNSSRLSMFQEYRSEEDEKDEKKKAIEAEMVFRIKLKKFYSTDKLDKKEEMLKRKVQKAKYFNIKAAKVFKRDKTIKINK